MISLKDRLKVWLQKQPMVWRSGVEIDKMVSTTTKHGGSYATRALRMLAEEGEIECREMARNGGKKIAWYRFNPETHAPTLARKSIEWFDSLEVKKQP